MARGNGKVRVCQKWICRCSKPGAVQSVLPGIREESRETNLSQADLSDIRKTQEDNTQIGGLSHHYDVI